MLDEELAEFGHVLGCQHQGLLRVQLLLNVVIVVVIYLVWLLLSDGVFDHLLLFAINASSSSIDDAIGLISAVTFRLAPIRSTRCAYSLLCMVVRTSVAKRWPSLLFAVAV